MNKLTAYIILLMVTSNMQAQIKEDDFEQSTLQQGLSDNFITSIVQDESGFIWIGTSTGLNRFDGSRFTGFYHTAKNNSIPHSGIERLKYAGRNRLIVVTKEGISVFNTKTLAGKTYRVPDTTNFSVYVNSTWDATEIPGSGFFVSSPTGFFFFNYNGDILWRYDAYTQKDIGKTLRYGREHLLLPDNKLIAYYQGGGAKLFDANSKMAEDISDGSPYFTFRLKPWLGRVTDGKGDYFFTGINDNRLYYYNFTHQKLEISFIPLEPKRDLHWPSNLFILNDSLFAITCATGGFLLVHFNKTA